MKSFVILCLFVFHLAFISCIDRDYLNTLAVAEAIQIVRPNVPTHYSESIGGYGGVPADFQALAETANQNLLDSTGASTLDPDTVKPTLPCEFVNRDGRLVHIYDEVIVLQHTGATLESTFDILRNNYLLQCCAYDTFAISSLSVDFDSDGVEDFYALTVIVVALSSIPCSESVDSLPVPFGTCIAPCGELSAMGGPVAVTAAESFLVQGFLESDANAFIIPEKRGVYLEDDLEVDFVPSFGTYSTLIREETLPNGNTAYIQDATDTRGVIPAGSIVSSYLFHYDPVGINASFTSVRDLAITFDTPILGVAAKGTPPFEYPTVLDKTDVTFGRQCSNYRNFDGSVQQYRGIEMALLDKGPPRVYEAEGFTVHGNTIVISNVHVAAEAIDQLRIFVGCSDEFICRDIVSTSGQVTVIEPPAVYDGTDDSVYTSYTSVFAFRENAYVVGVGGVAVDTKFANEDGSPTCEGRCTFDEYDVNQPGVTFKGLTADYMTAAETTVIQAGVKLQSFLVRSNLPAGPNTQYSVFSGCIEFGNTIIGVIWSGFSPSPADLLPGSDAIFGNVCTDYVPVPTALNRGLDDNGNAAPSDIVWLTSPSSLCFVTRARTTSVDDFRVLTLCGAGI